MSEFTVKTGTGTEEKIVTVAYVLPATHGDLVNAFGEAVVYDFASRSMLQAVQNLARVGLQEGSSQEAIQAKVDSWVPGVRSAGKKKSDLTRAENLLANLTPDELTLLQGKVAAAKKAASKIV